MKMSTAMFVAALAVLTRSLKAAPLECIQTPDGNFQSQSGHVLPEYNVENVPGGDPTYGGTAQDSAQLCWAFCASVKGCLAATYNLQGTVNCYLKTVSPGPGNSEPNSNAVTLSACGDPGRIDTGTGASPPAAVGTPPAAKATPPAADTTTPPTAATAPPTGATTPPTAATTMPPPAAAVPPTVLPAATVPLPDCTTALLGMDYNGFDVAEMTTATGEECATLCAFVVQCTVVSYLNSGKCYLKSQGALAAGATAKASTKVSYDLTNCKDESYTVLDITDPADQAGLLAKYPTFVALGVDTIATDTPMMPPTAAGASPPLAIPGLPGTVSMPPPVSTLTPTPGTPKAAAAPPANPEAGGSQTIKIACTLAAMAVLATLLL